MMPSAPNVVSEIGFNSLGMTWKIGTLVVLLRCNLWRQYRRITPESETLPALWKTVLNPRRCPCRHLQSADGRYYVDENEAVPMMTMRTTCTGSNACLPPSRYLNFVVSGSFY